MMVNFYSGFVVAEAARDQAEARRDAARRAPRTAPNIARAYAAWSKEYQMPRGTVADVADHIDHIVKVAGIDHAGIGSDFDGITAWPVGLEDVSCYPRLTEELLSRGYSEADIHKILGGNVLRAFREAGAGRRATPQDDEARGRSAQAREDPRRVFSETLAKRSFELEDQEVGITRLRNGRERGKKCLIR